MENVELQIFLEAIYSKYGYDFRNYSSASIKRRLNHRLNLARFTNLGDMQKRVLDDQNFFRSLLLDLSINFTEMFRDPSFYKAIRKSVIPILKKLPSIKIWHAGCSSGEEVYSMAILLKEEGLLDRSLIYATDFNEIVLMKAREGIYPVSKIKDYTNNYQQAGGTSPFSDYYTAMYDSTIINKSLKKNIIFSQHNLVTDKSFGEMDLIICRNVLIYFNKTLQNNVIGLFKQSLSPKGILCLGSKENIRFNSHAQDFDSLIDHEKIYRKKVKINAK